MAYKAHFLNVGCADCTIFEIGDDVVMIDCGYRKIGDNVLKPTNIFEYLTDVMGKTEIDLLIITHAHHDHYIGTEDLIGEVVVHKLWDSPYKRRHGDNSLSSEEWNSYKSLREKLVPEKSMRFICYEGAKANFAEVEFKVIAPSRDLNNNDTRECHDGCLVISVSSPSNKFIVCGDASGSELEDIISRWSISNCSILRTSHHGSINGASLDFIKEASPNVSIVSTASGIYDNVPSQTALQRYRNYSNNVIRTDTNGTITAKLK